jgi:hypothetical protein
MVIYIETSVPSGWGRKVFDAPLEAFYDAVRNSDCTIIVPQHTFNELRNKKTPNGVFEKLNTIKYIVKETPPGAEALANVYMEKRLIPSGYYNDALHIAIATILEVDVLVTWNQTHIVNTDMIPRINEINIKKGYKPIVIKKPEEILSWIHKLT